jgi:hypothetical protein
MTDRMIGNGKLYGTQIIFNKTKTTESFFKQGEFQPGSSWAMFSAITVVKAGHIVNERGTKGSFYCVIHPGFLPNVQNMKHYTVGMINPV